MGGGWVVVVATNFNVSSRQAHLSPSLPFLAFPCLTLASASQLFLGCDDARQLGILSTNRLPSSFFIVYIIIVKLILTVQKK